VVKGNPEFFCKADYTDKLPYNEADLYKSGTAGKKYWELVQQTGKNSCLLE
jgi:hypothetical protein